MFVDLLITVVEYKVEGQRTSLIERKGLCSNYLANLEVGSEVSMYLRASPSFHLPETSETKKPLLLGEFWNTFNAMSIYILYSTNIINIVVAVQHSTFFYVRTVVDLLVQVVALCVHVSRVSSTCSHG